jgi:3-oxoacyl-[acyl-carrier-protein] synthase-1
MRRVVITGLGIVSCLGNDKATVSANLRAGNAGIRHNPSYAEMGLRSQVSGSVNLNLEELIDASSSVSWVMPLPMPTWPCSRPSKTPA